MINNKKESEWVAFVIICHCDCDLRWKNKWISRVVSTSLRGITENMGVLLPNFLAVDGLFASWPGTEERAVYVIG